MAVFLSRTGFLVFLVVLSAQVLVPYVSPAEAQVETYVFVQTRFAEIKENPTMDSATVGVSVIGERLGHIGTDSSGFWVRVRSGKGEGWLPKVVVSTVSPEAALQAQKQQNEIDEQTRAAELQSSRGPASVKRAKGKVKAATYSPALKTGMLKIDLDALEKFEKFKVGDSELKKFQKKARLTTN